MGPGGGMGWMWLWWLLILAGLAALVFALVRSGRSGARAGGETASSVSTAQQILDERFARGEIDEEEYRARRKALDD